MSSNSESGHAINLANFLKLGQTVLTFGPAFNPGPAALTLANQTNLYNQADAAQSLVNNTKADWQEATNVRADAFVKLKDLIPRLERAVKISGASKETLKDLLALTRKIKGNTGKKNSDDKKEPDATSINPEETTNEDDTSKSYSKSQQSMNQKINNFDSAIAVVENVGTYNPNEADLTIPALKAFLTNLKAQNTNVNNAWAQLRKALGDRNKIFYTKTTGMIDIANNIKDYVMSVFGKNSQEYGSVKSIKFKNFK